jgi:hypothetical protein
MEPETLHIGDELRAVLVTVRAVGVRPLFAPVVRVSHVQRIFAASLTVAGADPPPMACRTNPAFAHRVL